MVANSISWLARSITEYPRCCLIGRGVHMSPRYFAGAYAVAKTDRPKFLAVWALFSPKDLYTGTLFEVYQGASNATNPNLRAQAGVFTVAHGEPWVLDRMVQDLHAEGVRLRRLTLPIGEAPKLLRFLSHDEIDGSTMFPGADGVVRALRERALWDDPGDGAAA